MNKEQKRFYRDGYDECRLISIVRLKNVLEKRIDVRSAMIELISQFEQDMEADHWRSFQEDVPGIIKEEYEAEIEASNRAIRVEFFSPVGHLKLRLARKR